MEPLPPPADETPEPARKLSPPEATAVGNVPLAAPLPTLVRTAWGAPLLVGGSGCAYLVLGQILPAVVLVVYIAVVAGVQATPKTEEEFAPYVPYLAGWTALASLAVIGALRLAKHLPPHPRAPASVGRSIAWAAILGVAALLGQQGIAWLLTRGGVEFHEQEIVKTAFAEGPNLPVLLAICFCAPLGEELFFRRFAFATLRVGNGRIVAYLATIAAFGLIHMNLSGLALYCWLGLCVTIGYEKTGRTLVPIGVHAMNNLVATVLSWP